MRIAVVGAGNLGRAIIRNVAGRNVEVVAVKRKPEVIEGAEVVTDVGMIGNVDLVIVALKPNVFRESMVRIAEAAGDVPVVSFAAGVKLDEMAEHISRPYRAMTNLAIEERSVVACYPPETSSLLSFMDAEFIACESEDELEAMTSYIGSSPAIIAYLIHAFIIAALKDGVDYSRAEKIAKHAFTAAASLYGKYGLEGLVRRVATPGGTTVEGILGVKNAERYFMDSLLSASAKARKV